MSDNKKYYYMKLKESFYDYEEMIVLENMPDGYLYSNILLKLYLRSLKNDGCLIFKSVVPYTPSMLAKVIRHNVRVVEKALKIFIDLGLIEILDNGAIYMSNIQNYIGSSSSEADRQREYGKKIAQEKKILQEKDVRNLTENGQDFYTRDRDRDRDRDKDKDKDRDICGDNSCSSSSQDENLKKAGDLFLSEGFGPVTSVIVDQLKDLIDEYSLKWLETAIRKAVLANKRSLNYVQGILKNWKSQGGIDKNKRQKSDANFEQREYSKEYFKDLEKKLLNHLERND